MVQANDGIGQAVYNEYLGNVFLKREEFEAAEDYYSNARKFLEDGKQEERVAQLDEKMQSIKKHPGYLGKKEADLLKEIPVLVEKGHSRELLDKYQALEDIYFQWSRMDKVAEVTEKSIEILEALGDRHSAGICYGNLATMLLQIGVSGDAKKLDQAEEYCRKAIEIIAEGKDTRRKSYLLGSLGNICLQKKNLDQAWQEYQESLKYMVELGDQLGEARGYSNLGNVRRLQKDWPQAIENYEKSYRLMEALENRPGMAQQCEALGDLYLKTDDLEKAEGSLNQASKLYEDMKEPASVRQIQEKLVYIMGHPKYLERRQKELCDELDKPETDKDEKLKAALLGELGNVYFMVSEFESAIETLKECAEVQGKLKDEGGQSSTWGNLGSIQMEMQDFEGAAESYGKAAELKEKLQDINALVELYNSLANALLRLGKLVEAEKIIKKSFNQNTKASNQKGLVTDHRNLGNLSLQKTDWST
jgi:tetratricopeptide (TPR) repeat protein